MKRTKIEWADSVANPITGCTPASEGCLNCYAKRFANRLARNPMLSAATRKKYEGFRPGQFHEERLEEIEKAPKGSTVFVGSMADLFHEAVNLRGPEIREVLRSIGKSKARCLLLTKRPRRMAEALRWHYGDHLDVEDAPLPNLWLGVSVEHQKTAGRIAELFTIPAAGRFVSVEPMLGPVDLTQVELPWSNSLRCNVLTSRDDEHLYNDHPKLDWVICGGETGPQPRELQPEWARGLRDQCAEYGVPYFFKGWGDVVHRDQMTDETFSRVDAAVNLGTPEGPYFRVGKKAAGRLLDEREHLEFPWT